MIIQDNDNMTQLAFMIALSQKAKGGNNVSPSDVKEAVNDYLEAHPATADSAGTVKIGSGISVDENGVISLDEEVMADLVSAYLEDNADEITDDEIKDLWNDPN